MAENRKPIWPLLAYSLILVAGLMLIFNALRVHDQAQARPSGLAPTMAPTTVSGPTTTLPAPAPTGPDAAELKAALLVGQDKLKNAEKWLEIERNAANPLRDKVNDLRLARDAAVARVAELEARLKEKETALAQAAEAKKEAASLAQRVAELQKETAALRDERSALRASVTALEKARDDANAQAAQLKRDLDSARVQAVEAATVKKQADASPKPQDSEKPAR